MAFVRYKIVGGKKYYQLVRNYREAGRHRQEVLCHLGTNDSLEAAIAEESKKEARLRSYASERRRNLEETKTKILGLFDDKFGPDLPGPHEAKDRERAVRKERENLVNQPLSWQRLDGLNRCSEELHLLHRALDYHWRSRSAEWFEEQADAQLRVKTPSWGFCTVANSYSLLPKRPS